MAVNVTDTAAREIASIIRQQELDLATIHLRVGVRGGGCSGFSYLLDLTETQRDSDETWEFTFELAPVAAGAAKENGEGGTAVATEDGPSESFTLRVICDPKSYLYLNGTSIDFKETIMERGFVFNNPNASSSCGCGSSFAV